MINAFSWNPRRPLRIPGQQAHPLARINNFGDLLGPMLVDRLAPDGQVRNVHGRRRTKLLSVGSVMHFARNGDTVWGTGVNGKVPLDKHRFTHLDVRAVRGPLTKRYLEEMGLSVPSVFGDPGLLIPRLFPELAERATHKLYDITIVPNLNDWPNYADATNAATSVMNPTDDLWTCLNRIASSSMVVGSSLHGIVIAESLGIPARLVKSHEESDFKYQDYYGGTGRTDVQFASSVSEALSLGGAAPAHFDVEGLLNAFPLDLWKLENRRVVA